MDLWNVGILPQHYTASQPWRPLLEARSCYLITVNSKAHLEPNETRGTEWCMSDRKGRGKRPRIDSGPSSETHEIHGALPSNASEVKVKLSLCLTKYHIMKTHPELHENVWRCGSIDPRINFGTRLRRLFTPRTLYPRGKSPLYQLDRRLGGPRSQPYVSLMFLSTMLFWLIILLLRIDIGLASGPDMSNCGPVHVTS
jgi:hypothetical protein